MPRWAEKEGPARGSWWEPRPDGCFLFILNRIARAVAYALFVTLHVASSILSNKSSPPFIAACTPFPFPSQKCNDGRRTSSPAGESFPVHRRVSTVAVEKHFGCSCMEYDWRKLQAIVAPEVGARSLPSRCLVRPPPAHLSQPQRGSPACQGGGVTHSSAIKHCQLLLMDDAFRRADLIRRRETLGALAFDAGVAPAEPSACAAAPPPARPPTLHALLTCLSPPAHRARPALSRRLPQCPI